MRRFVILLLAAVMTGSCSGEPAAPDALRLDLLAGQHAITMSIAQTVRMTPKLLSATGDTMPMPLGLVTTSSDPAKVAVDGIWLTSIGTTPGVMVRGSVVYHGKAFTDSISVVVSCPLVLTKGVSPATMSLAVGETSAPPVVTLAGGCGPVSDTFVWTVDDATIVSVSSVNGAVTGLKVGQTTVRVRGVQAGSIGAIAATVR